MADSAEKHIDEEWSTVIKPRESLLDVDFKEIWKYRDLWSLFVKRDIITQYKQTVLGPLWYFVQPIMTTIMYMVVFGGIAGISTDGLPQALFYLSGICMWQYFSECMTKTSNTFVSNASVFGKVYFPRLTTPISQVLTSLINFFIQFVMYILFWVYFAVTGSGVHLTAWAWALSFPP